MAYTSQHLLLLVAFVGILLGMPGQSLRGAPEEKKPSKDEDMKQPELFMSKSDRSVLIPGIGRAMLPSFPIPTTYGFISYGHLPAGDDTSVANPIPSGSGDGVKAPAGGGGHP